MRSIRSPSSLLKKTFCRWRMAITLFTRWLGSTPVASVYNRTPKLNISSVYDSAGWARPVISEGDQGVVLKSSGARKAGVPTVYVSVAGDDAFEKRTCLLYTSDAADE